MRSWLPGGVSCPFDGASESIVHAITACKFLHVAYDAVDNCFPSKQQGVSVSASTIIHSNPLQSLTSPQGELAWSAFISSWTARGIAKRDPSEVVS